MMKQHAGHLAALLFAGSALSPACAAEAYSTWDNFNVGTEISAARWLNPERVRLIESGAMHVVQRDRGSQSGNAGLYHNSWDSYLKNPALITQMRAILTVNEFDVTGCAANVEASFVQARMVGLYFNAGPGLPTSVINDVGATARLMRASNSADASGLLRVQGTVFQCTTSDCNGFMELGVADLGTAAIGEAVTLKMEWEPASNRFNFYRGSNPVMRVSYTASDAQAPYFPFRGIGTRTSLANCFSGNRTEGFIDAKFDNVSVNASAAP